MISLKYCDKIMSNNEKNFINLIWRKGEQNEWKRGG